MERLTPEQFYEQNRERFLYQIPVKPQSVCIQEMMQAYAEHLEETAWVTDGSLPPFAQDSKTVSDDVLTVQQSGNIFINWYDFTSDSWAKYGKSVIAWRPLPTPPKNL